MKPKITLFRYLVAVLTCPRPHFWPIEFVHTYPNRGRCRGCHTAPSRWRLASPTVGSCYFLRRTDCLPMLWAHAVAVKIPRFQLWELRMAATTRVLFAPTTVQYFSWTLCGEGHQHCKNWQQHRSVSALLPLSHCTSPWLHGLANDRMMPIWTLRLRRRGWTLAQCWCTRWYWSNPWVQTWFMCCKLPDRIH